jgi:peptide deformylase
VESSPAAAAELRMSRVFAAPRRIVFAAWSSAENVARWFAPAPLTITRCEVDLRPGGVFRLVMRMPSGVEHPMEGTFVEVVPDERIVFRASIADGVEIQTTVTFAAEDGKTTLSVHQIYSRQTDATRGAPMGWTATLDQLAQWVDEANQPPIVQIGDPVLRARAKEVRPDAIGTPAMQELISTMVAVMRAAPGVGLAAPQIGIPLRVIVLEDPEAYFHRLSAQDRAERERFPVPLRVLVNPVLRPVGDTRVTFFEGCLSVSGYAGLVERYREVAVEGLDATGSPVQWQVAGWPARILQHEVDHVDGTVYVDRMITRSFSTTEHAALHFAGKSIAEIRSTLGV